MDTDTAAGAGFVQRECVAFNQILFALKASPVDVRKVIYNLRKMYTFLQEYRAKVGRTDADRMLDSVLSFARDAVLELGLG